MYYSIIVSYYYSLNLTCASPPLHIDIPRKPIKKASDCERQWKGMCSVWSYGREELLPSSLPLDCEV